MERVCQKCFFLSKNAIYFNKNGQILCEIPHKKTFWEQILMFFSYLHCLDKKKLLVYFENHK